MEAFSPASIRIGLFASMVLAPLVAAPLPLAGGEPLQIRYNLTDADFQRSIATLGAGGFQPVSVSGYDLGGEDRYAVIWEKRAAPIPWMEKHNITAEEFQDNFDALLGRGCRPVSLCGYNVAGAARYSAVWELRGGDNWRVRTGVSGEEILKSNADFARDDFRPITADGYTAGRDLQFAVLWERTQRPANDFRMDLSLSAAEFDQASKGLSAGGFHPVSLSGHNAGGATRFSAIWEKATKAEFEVSPMLEPDQLGERLTSLPANGFQPLSLRAYSAGDKPRFAAIWKKKAL